ncbi:MAG TPA: B12-binding domain-containing radical SAM protein [Ruminiclostridium sp.]|nr:B12-binding domain-containing radical SAM protein [Ruminiclostridium sp.]
MKTVIAAVNSKYVHMSLAPWYLKAASADVCEIRILELTINQDKSEILRSIYKEKPDVLGFSCYIFNISLILEIVKDLRTIFPNIVIVLGGPEVSFDPVEILQNNSEVDYVICSEGEVRSNRLLTALSEGKKPSDIDGIAFRVGNQVKFNPPADFIKNLDTIASPYTEEMLKSASGKIAYFESSRGCPFSCAYCLSPQTGGVRRFSMGRVKDDLKKLMLSDVRQIKFVDRTFNCSAARAKEIIRFIIESAESDKTGTVAKKNYHFEAAADLFDDEMIEILSSAQTGLFQLEIGIQSFNEKTLEAATRKTNITLCEKNIKKLVSRGNMHIHLDLIAGLPYENFESFSGSFNRIFALAPHCIQLGFLKLLKGSSLRSEAEKYGIKYSHTPPYEVLSTPWLSYDEILKLKDIEVVVDALYNSGKFNHSFTYIIPKFNSPFNFFFKFSRYLKKFYPEGYGIPSRELYNIFMKFSDELLSSDDSISLNELLKFDFFISDNSCNPPKALTRAELPNARDLYAAEKSTGRRVHFERFSVNPLDPVNKKSVVIKFDYTLKNPVTGHYSYSFV